jgi:hypothetical protein
MTKRTLAFATSLIMTVPLMTLPGFAQTSVAPAPVTPVTQSPPTSGAGTQSPAASSMPPSSGSSSSGSSSSGSSSSGPSNSGPSSGAPTRTATPVHRHPGAPGQHAPMRAQRVERLQTALNASGATVTVDGKMGPKTRAALADFQKAHGLKVTGRPDKETIDALKASG